ncbi:MAG: hypothetical protein RL308_1790 [Bacteroidota bacterium]|jgi:hypothetical protein
MKDTIIQNIQIQVQGNKKDSLNINLVDKKIEIANKSIQIDQVKSNYDYTYDFITGLGIVITAILSVISIRKLIKKDEQKQEQISELINQTKELTKHNTLYEKRLKLLTKPRLIASSGTIAPYSGEWSINVRNKGEDTTITKLEIVGGDVDKALFLLHGLPHELNKGQVATFTGSCVDIEMNKLTLLIKLSHEDLELNQYESYFEFKGGSTNLIETKEL